MIIVCEHCQTQFHLDDAKVPEGGTRVRCSRCRHAFFVEPPSSDEELAGDLARDALGSAGEGPGEDTESDWEFNDEPGAVEPGEASLDAFDHSFQAVDIEGASEGAGEELGSPESWDLVSGEDVAPAARPAVAPARPAAPMVIGRIALRRRAALVEEEPEEEEAEPSPAWVWPRRAGGAAGWALVAGLCLVALHGGATRGPWAAEPSAPTLRLGAFRVEAVEGRWIENAAAGPLFVVSGRLRNDGGSVASPRTRLQVRLLDAGGVALDAPTMALGPALAEERLREGHPGELRAYQEGASAWLASGVLAPGAAREFHAVMAGVPVEAFRFRIEPLRQGDG